MEGNKIETRLGEIRKNNFGTEMQIVRYKNSSDIDVKFLDKDKFVYKHTTYNNFKKGQIKNPYDRCIFGVGYLGEGEAQQKTQVGYCWRGMLERCYCDRMRKMHTAYYGISTVCDEWLNFQVFAKWYNENIYHVKSERMHLDKDILIKDNKIYSPETCLIVPQRVNMLFTNKSNRYNLPTGIKPDNNGKYEARYNGKLLGVFDTIKDAELAHENAKRNAIKKVAEEYKSFIPYKVYEALINW